jgi:hypothetical protein
LRTAARGGSPEQVLEAMTDSTDRRLEIWDKTLDPDVYEVMELGDTWGVARDGSPRSPYWVIARYDWSDPRFLLHHTMNRVIARMWRKALDRFALA